MRTKFGSQISFVFNLLVVVVAVGHLMAPGQPVVAVLVAATDNNNKWRPRIILPGQSKAIN